MDLKEDQLPYKMVSSYLNNKKNGVPKDARNTAAFGPWQLEPYRPPAIKEAGRVPTNRFGNVYLFQPQMLPLGCVLINRPNVGKVAKKLGIHVALAVVGYESHKLKAHVV